MTARAAGIAALLIAVAGLLFGSAEAGGASSTADRRILGGHSFIPSGQLEDPFIVTSVQNALGLGQARGLDNPVLEIGGEPVVQLEGKLTFVVLGFDYSQAVREWLAMSIRIEGVGRLGTNTTSLLAQGLQAVAGWGVGWDLRIARREQWTLTGVLELESVNLTSVNIVDWIEDAVDGYGTGLVRSSAALRGIAGLRGAYGFNPTVGVLGSFQSSYGEAADVRGVDRFSWRVEAGTSLDLLPARGWPIGFVLGGGYSSIADAGTDIADSQWFAFGRIAFTGRQDFVIGLDFMSQWLPQRTSSEHVRVAVTTIGLRYYF